MSTSTTNYSLVKPALTDAADITATNGNWDTIDTTLKSLSDNKAAASHNHSASDITSGTLPVARGGTGAATLTSGSYLVGNGTDAVTLKTVAQVLAEIVSAASITTTELGYLSGVTSAIQGQLNSKQGTITYSDTDLTAGTSSLATGQFYAYYE